MHRVDGRGVDEPLNVDLTGSLGTERRHLLTRQADVPARRDLVALANLLVRDLLARRAPDWRRFAMDEWAGMGRR